MFYRNDSNSRNGKDDCGCNGQREPITLTGFGGTNELRSCAHAANFTPITKDNIPTAEDQNFHRRIN